MGNYSIRPLVSADESFLWKMLYEAIYVPAEQPRPSRKIVKHPQLAKYVRDWGQPGDYGFVAVDAASEQPIGAVWSRLLTGKNKGYGYVNDETPELSIAVLPEYRDKGVGTQLLTRMLEAMQSRYPAISLSVALHNPALRLYSRLGFAIVDRQGTSVTMIKSLE